MSPRPLPCVPTGRWVEQVRESELAAVRAEVDDLVHETGLHPAAALVEIYDSARRCVVDQTLRGGAPGSRETARLRAAGALVRELRTARSRDRAA